MTNTPHNQQALFDAEDSIAFRAKIRTLRQRVADALAAKTEARSNYALACSRLKTAQKELDAALAADCVPLPLFDHLGRTVELKPSIVTACEGIPVDPAQQSSYDPPLSSRFASLPPEPAPPANLDSPQAVIAQVNAALLSALYMGGGSADAAWSYLIRNGATDDDIKNTIASEWLTPCSGSDHGGWYARGGKGAGFWHGVQGPMGKALLSGKALIARVRKVLSIGQRQKGGK